MKCAGCRTMQRCSSCAKCCGWAQAGAGRLLAATDLTGSTPAQLATEKGHRFLAMYLHDAAQKHQRKQRCALLRAGMWNGSVTSYALVVQDLASSTW